MESRMADAETLQKVSYAEIITRLTRARKMNVSGLSAEDVDRRVGLIMNGYHTVAIKGQLNGLYRARKNIGDQPCQSTSDLWYPPASAVLNRGRFNEPGAPVFYACNRGVGAIFEVCPNIGDIITLLVVRAKTEFAELDCAHIGLERSFAPELGGTQRGLMLRNNPQFQAMLKQYNISKKWLMVDEFLSEMGYCSEFRTFKRSTTLASLLGVVALTCVSRRKSPTNISLQPKHG